MLEGTHVSWEEGLGAKPPGGCRIFDKINDKIFKQILRISARNQE